MDWNELFYRGARDRPERDEAWLDPQKIPNAKKLGTAEPLDTGTAAELDTGTPLDTGTADSSSSAAGADTTAKMLECHYKHTWCPHTGWKSRIQMKSAKKRNRYVCAPCIEWLQRNGVQFQFTPCAEEENQIY